MERSNVAKHAGSASIREPSSPEAKKTVGRAFLGFWVDYYDIYLPIVALAPAIGYFQPGYLSAEVQITLFYVSFAVTLIARPIGAAIFGPLADTMGRRKMTLISMGGFGVVTLLIACLPGYESIGIASFVLFMSLRFLDGIFLGAEYTSANTLAMEISPKHRRGLYGSFIAVAYPLAYISISLVTAATLLFVPAGSPQSPYAQWGWRIPFVLGAVFALLVLLYFRRVAESDVWEGTAKAGSPMAPLRELLRGRNLRNLGQVFLLTSGLWLAVMAVISAAPGLLIGRLGQSEQAVTNAVLVANVFLAAGYIASGVLSQAMGRRRYFIVAGSLAATVGAACYYFAIRALDGQGTFVTGMILYGVALVLSISCFSVILPYINERFPTRVRSSGYGIGYSFAIIPPSFYGLYMLGLDNLMPYKYTPVPLLVLGGLLLTVGAWLGPETRDADLRGRPTARTEDGFPAQTSGSTAQG